LAGQVAVGVEVAVECAVAGEQQVPLLACFVVPLLGLTPLTLTRSGVVLDLEVELDRPSGGKVQIAPALEGVVEFAVRALEGLFRPRLCEPGCALRCQFILQHGQHS
jgi:hypothetical protein